MSRIASYTTGLILALILTIAAFAMSYAHSGPAIVSSAAAVVIILILAFVQLFVQLFFFLHLGLQKEARWNTFMFVATFSGILVIICASIWIMYHLNYNMTPAETNRFIENQSGL